MKTLKKLFATACFIALTVNLTAQTTWTGNGSNIYLNPLAGRVGIGTASPSGKLHLVHNHAASETSYGMYLITNNTYPGQNATYGIRSASTSGVNNTGIHYGTVSVATNNNTTSSSATYGFYTNTASQNKGHTYGYWSDVSNTNPALTSNVYGIRAAAKAASTTAPVYGIVTAVSGGSTLYGLYTGTTNNNASTSNYTYGARTIVSSQNKGAAFGYDTDVKNTNTTSTAGVYGIRTVSKSSSSASTVYGIHAAVSGGKQRWAGYFTGGDMYVSGNVGIGTATPQAKLDVAGSINIGHDIRLGTGNKQFIFHTQMSNPNDPPIVFIAPKLSNNTGFDWNKQIILKNDGSLLMSAGSLGVGTGNITPVAKLQVNAEGNPSNLENNINNGFAIKGSDQVLYMGVNSTNHVSYIQSVNTGTSVAPLLLNARGGNVGIGRTDPFYKLDVNGIVRAHEIKVNTNTGADFVFAENYPLRSLNEVSGFIQANKHLPEIPPAADMVANGVDMGEFQIKLLQKIEELTLYVIEQDKQLKEQKKQLMQQQEEIEQLKIR